MPRQTRRAGPALALTVAVLVLAAVPAASSGEPVARPGPAVAYRPPADGVVTRLFDPPLVRWAAGHRGIDLAALPGDPVTTPAAGVVTFAGTVVDRGVVTVRHADGRRSSLEPLDPAVDAGDVLAAGATVGTVQARERPAHAGLHWGVREGTAYVDPLDLLPGTAPVVLLPVS